MKTELTLENKAKFFAQYWGQLVIEDVNGKGETFLYPVVYSNMYRFEESTVVLKPISSISAEDAYGVGVRVNCWSWAERNMSFFENDEMKEVHVDGGKMFAEAIGKPFGPGMSHPFAQNSTDILNAYDFLRSKSYALPWMGISVEEMVASGWIKLRS